MSQQRTGAHGGMETSFGFQDVSDGEKQTRVNDVFHRVAKRYDVMNDLMSGGLHRVWKDSMIAWLAPSRTASWKVLDVAGGTGDVAFRIVEASNRNAHATVLDINGSMLGVGRDRAEKRGLADNAEFVEANAEELPFGDATFRRLYDRLRHPQCAAYRSRTVRGLPCVEAGRAVSLPRIFRGRIAGP